MGQLIITGPDRIKLLQRSTVGSTKSTINFMQEAAKRAWASATWQCSSTKMRVSSMTPSPATTKVDNLSELWWMEPTSTSFMTIFSRSSERKAITSKSTIWSSTGWSPSKAPRARRCCSKPWKCLPLLKFPSWPSSRASSKDRSTPSPDRATLAKTASRSVQPDPTSWPSPMLCSEATRTQLRP